MKPEASRADRLQEVREAARGWSRAGWIDVNALRAIEAAYPDDRVRSGPVFRILFFVLTFGALLAAIGIVGTLVDSRSGHSVLAFCVALSCAAVADHMLGPLRRRQGGVEAAFSVVALLAATIGMGLTLDRVWGVSYPSLFDLLMVFVALISGIAAWRWGYWIFAAVAAYAAYSFSLSLTAGALLWVVVVSLGFRILINGCDADTLPPSIRKCSAAVLVVAVLSLYATVNVVMYDQKPAGLIMSRSARYLEFFPRWLALALTAAVPIAAIAVGLAERRRLVLNLGFILGALSLATVRFYYHVAPPWVALTAAGILLFTAAGILRRFLDSGAGGERGGFTASTLAEDPAKRRAVETIAGIAILTPGPTAQPRKSDFAGRGGEFGGGGASGDF